MDRFFRPDRARNHRKATPRDGMYIAIVNKLNEQGLQGEEKNIRELYDCKGLGIVLVSWGYGGWKKEWFDKVKDVTELVDEKILFPLLPKNR